MPKQEHERNYAADVEQDRRLNTRKNKPTAAQIVQENDDHWVGYAKAGATLKGAVERVAAPYDEVKDGVITQTVVRGTLGREFNRRHGGWKAFRATVTGSPVLAPSGKASQAQVNSTAAPVLNDDRANGGHVWGAGV